MKPGPASLNSRSGFATQETASAVLGPGLSMTEKIKRKPLLPRKTVKIVDYKASAEDTIKRFPVTMAYLGRDDWPLPRLKSLPPLLRREQPLLKRDDEQERNKRRYQEQPWRKWYQSKDWYRLRWSTLTRDAFTCQECGIMESDTSKLVCDHIKTHGGDWGLFTDPENLRCLCKPCHDSVKQREDKARHR